MAQYVLISNGDENLSYSIDTDEERTAARAALTAAGETSAAIYVGDPEDPSSYATGERFILEATRLELILAQYARENTAPIAPVRAKRFARAIELGATDKALQALCGAARTSDKPTIVLPPHRYQNLSRGKGWCRKGSKNNAEWGERVDGGYEVGPGKWTVGGNDGFSRKGEDSWTVKHVQVGPETWTVAS